MSYKGLITNFAFLILLTFALLSLSCINTSRDRYQIELDEPDQTIVKNITESTIVAISNDKRHYVEKTEDCDAQIVRLSGEKQCTLEDSNHKISSGSFSYHNRFFAANVEVVRTLENVGRIDRDRDFWIWSASNGKLLKIIDSYMDWGGTITFSENGQFLVVSEKKDSFSGFTKIRIWSAIEGQLLITFSDVFGEGYYPPKPAISQDGRFLAIGNDNVFSVWSIGTGEMLFRKGLESSSVKALAFSMDGEVIAFGNYNKTINLYSTQTGKFLKTLTLSEGENSYFHESSYTLAFSRNGEVIASGDESGVIRLWSIGSGKIIQKINAHRGRINSLSFQSSDKVLLSFSDYEIKKWKVETVGDTHRKSPASIEYSSSNNFNGYDFETGNYYKSIDRELRKPGSLKYSPDGEHVLVTRYRLTHLTNPIIDLFSTKNWDVVHEISVPLESIRKFEFSNDSKLFYTADLDGDAIIYSVDTGELLGRDEIEFKAEHHRKTVFSPDGKLRAFIADDFKIEIFSRHPGQLLHEFWGHTNLINSIEFSPDSKFLASSSHDYTIKLWKIDKY